MTLTFWLFCRGHVLLECLEAVAARLFGQAPASTAPSGIGRMLSRVSDSLASGEPTPNQAQEAARFWTVRTNA